MLPDLASKSSRERLLQFKDKHKGERCVIIGNGPSLRKMDLSFLENEITFGLNRIYLLSEELGFYPDYYVSVNPLVIEQSIEEILNLPSPKFISHKGFAHVVDPEQVIFLESIPKWFFSRDPGQGICEGYTVTYVAMQLAYYMGFDDVVLIGVDHHFVTPGPANLEVVSQGDDPNHFHPNYFGKGVRWHLPDLENSEVAYRLANEAFTGSGRKIIDATLNGKLEIFPKVNYLELFERYRQQDELLTANLSEAEYLIRTGEHMYQQGDINAAFACFQDALVKYPANSSVMNNLGVINWERKNPSEAIRYFSAALTADPNNRESAVNLTETLLSLGLSHRIFTMVSDYVNRNPGDHELATIVGALFY